MVPGFANRLFRRAHSTRSKRSSRMSCRLQMESLEARQLLTTTMVKNMSPLGDGSPRDFTQVGDITYFVANDGEHGDELWRTDGTPEGTELIVDIQPGASSGAPQNLTPLGDLLFFTASREGRGRELFVSDGTPAGTVMVTDIHLTGSSAPAELVALDDLLFFTAYEPEHGRELWQSDGTPAGTVLVEDLREGGASSLPSDLTVMNHRLYFAATGPDAIGRELWSYEPQDDHVQLVRNIADLHQQSSDPEDLMRAGNRIFFTARGPTDLNLGRELYVTDGTVAGTAMVMDIHTGSSDSDVTFLASEDNTVYFQANNGIKGRELWKSDGTAAGTSLVIDYSPGISSSDPTSVIVGADGLFVLYNMFHHLVYVPYQGEKITIDNQIQLDSELFANDNLVYYVRRTSGDDYELWKVNQVTRQQALVSDINPGARGSFPHDIFPLGHVVYFAATNGTHGYELWRTEDSPIVDIGGMPTGNRVTEGSSVHLTSALSWPGSGAPYRHQWVVTNANDPAGTPIVGSSSDSLTFTPYDDGHYLVTLTITDVGGGTSIVTRELPVDNVAPQPVIVVPEGIQAPHVPLRLTSRVTDAGLSDTYEYQWRVVFDGSEIESGTSPALSFTPDAIGTYTAQLTVTDNGGDATTTTESVVVTYSNAQRVVRSLYQQLLGRYPNLPGLLYWSDRLTAGLSEQALANALLRSLEYRRGRVVALYEQYLHRTPNALEVDRWADTLITKERETDLVAALLVSDEYRQQPENSDLVAAIFRDVLQRNPNEASRAFWERKLDGTRASRRAVVVGILFSRESYRRQVEAMYDRLAVIPDTDHETRDWATRLFQKEASLDELCVFLVGRLTG
ncbi:MAG: DUF4214 domain-containing protein [Planctomycetales bacterium]|nr:DUF4214 domain-containing protein [Planctomycetales bacterium]